MNSRLALVARAGCTALRAPPAGVSTIADDSANYECRLLRRVDPHPLPVNPRDSASVARSADAALLCAIRRRFWLHGTSKITLQWLRVSRGVKLKVTTPPRA